MPTQRSDGDRTAGQRSDGHLELGWFVVSDGRLLSRFLGKPAEGITNHVSGSSNVFDRVGEAGEALEPTREFRGLSRWRVLFDKCQKGSMVPVKGEMSGEKEFLPVYSGPQACECFAFVRSEVSLSRRKSA